MLQELYTPHEPEEEDVGDGLEEDLEISPPELGPHVPPLPIHRPKLQ